MPIRKDIKSILVLTSGPIVIGQACEFDYSGTQACRALREEGFEVRLVGSNPASIVTDPALSDRTYMEPLDIDTLQVIVEKDKPDAILPTMGGQVALNAFIALRERGALDGVEVLGVTAESVEKAENRERFRDCMKKIGLRTPNSSIVSSVENAEKILEEVKLPAIIRPSFTLGGSGSGIAYNLEEYRWIVAAGLETSPINQVLVEESVLGWKEFEMEVVRDSKDNCMIVCSIENVDPMGVHTGDSVTVAPALTLTDKEYQKMRSASFDVMREIGVTTGGANVQFATNPEDGRMYVIEMNPRVSRSSALASKATGFPIARVAALLAVGCTLDEVKNGMLKNLPASFEPTLDYIVTKMPRFAFEKFPSVSNRLGTSMKSVGEVMAMGGSFVESLQKAHAALEEGIDGLEPKACEGSSTESILSELAIPTPDRLRKVFWALLDGIDVDLIYSATHIDKWFLREIERLATFQKGLTEGEITPDKLKEAKALGFADRQLARILHVPAKKITRIRKDNKIFPVCRRVDGCAGEFDAGANYMYLTYNASNCESRPTKRNKVIVIGSGPNRIGQGIEFDYCCVHAVWTFAREGFETIMINCNPETVSTDYDAPSIGEVKNFSHKLYFEPVNSETLQEIMRIEGSPMEGVVAQMGGQTALKVFLESEDLPVLGTKKKSVDISEDREKFRELLFRLSIQQPPGDIARTLEEGIRVGEKLGFPLLIRPSQVIGGRSMEIVWNMEDIKNSESFRLYEGTPILMDRYLQDAIEADLDCICDGEEVFVAGIMEHIEEAGIHSGDSSCVIPSMNLSETALRIMKECGEKLGVAMQVKGWLNVQFAIQGDNVYVLEANPRASRTVPFLSKFTGENLNEYACQAMIGRKLPNLLKNKRSEMSHVAVKTSIFPFRLFSADPILGPEMLSTGEVMGMGRDFPTAFYKSQLGIGISLPSTGTVFFSIKDDDKKTKALELARRLLELGFRIFATGGTHQFFTSHRVINEKVNKVLQGRPHVVDLMKDNKVHLIINTTKGKQSLADSYTIRETALRKNIPCYTSLSTADAVVKSMEFASTDREVFTLQKLK